MKLFTDNVAELFKLALEIEKEIDPTSALEICKTIIKSEAMECNVDMLELFYGKNIYSKMEQNLRNVSDAINICFIIACAKKAYNLIRDKGGYDITSKQTETSYELDDFFRWVCSANRRIVFEDCEHFANLISAMRNNTNMRIAMNDAYSKYPLQTIIQKTADGTISYRNGVLK